jgi:AraC-like DNA-binding protein
MTARQDAPLQRAVGGDGGQSSGLRGQGHEACLRRPGRAALRSPRVSRVAASVFPRVPGTVSTLLVLQKVTVLGALGFDTERILGLAGLSRDRLKSPHGRLPADANFSFWDAAIRVSGDPAIGLRVGAALRIGGLGSYEYLLRNSETLQQAAERADQFMSLVDDTARIEVRESDNVAALRIYRPGGYPFPPADVEVLFTAFASLLREEAPAFRPLAVRFVHAAPTDGARYIRHFGCAVSFECDFNELEFPLALLQERAKGADPHLGLVLEEYARHLVTQLPKADSLVSAARSEIVEELTQRAPNAASVARALHMSQRTLRRRLRAEGTSFQLLLEEVRAEIALRFVGGTREGFDAIAERLAFRDASAFFRAFRRWTGTTPAQYRERQRSHEPRRVGARRLEE